MHFTCDLNSFAAYSDQTDLLLFYMKVKVNSLVLFETRESLDFGKVKTVNV